MAEQGQSPKVGLHFVPGQIMAIYEHAPTAAAELAPAIQANLAAFLDRTKSRSSLGSSLLAETVVPVERVITLPVNGTAARSMAFVDVTADATLPLLDEAFIVEAANQRIISLVEAAFEDLGKGGFDQNGVRLVSISPNWYTATSQGGLQTVGGPGSIPVSPQAPINPADHVFHLDAVNAASSDTYALDYVRLLIEQGTGEGVQVIILDTTTPQDSAALAQAFPGQPLLASMHQGGRLTMHRYDTAVAPALGVPPVMAALNGATTGISIKAHNYPKADHGLFAAGIIHSLAPAAKLDLIQVLNDYGVGTLETAMRGVQYAMQQVWDQQAPLVINCSFTVLLPLPTRTQGSSTFYAHPAPLLNWANIATPTLLVDFLLNAIRAAFQPITSTADVLAVAAAGNDHQGGNRPQARMPAGLEGIIGVAALRQDGAPAEYSNWADAPLSAGMETFGGNINAATPTEADPLKGTLGIYTGAFPSGAANTSGWGRWAGTSFAAPVIAGVLALLRADGKTAAQAVQVIQDTLQEAPDAAHLFPIAQG